MIVLDASAALELLLATDTGREVARRINGPEPLSAPQLLVVECLQVIRRMVRRGDVSTDIGGELVSDLLDLDIDFYDHTLVARRVWELRENLTAYDATYVALSELLDAPLVTTDAKIAGAPGHNADVELISAL